MDRSAAKTFAVDARRILLEGVIQRAYLFGIRRDAAPDRSLPGFGGKSFSPAVREQRQQLIDHIAAVGFDRTMEEAAYTWFDRFIALRFMELHGYLPTRVRVFSNEQGDFRPEILHEARQIDLPGLDADTVTSLLDTGDSEALYRYLLTLQCAALHDALPDVFDAMDGWTVLLLPDGLLRADGLLARLVGDLPESDWQDSVQILGWLYQYYNTEPKDRVFDELKDQKRKIDASRIPAATQLFTPDWIVRWLVDNSLGRLWLEAHPESGLRTFLTCYVETPDVPPSRTSLRPEEIRFLDPCMGSGHVLVYAFDVLMQIYLECGYVPRDAARHILTDNLYGLDIDCRATQLAVFAVMMKARAYDRRLFRDPPTPHLACLADAAGTDPAMLPQALRAFGAQFLHADTVGSLLEPSVPVKEEDFAAEMGSAADTIRAMRRVHDILCQAYDCVVTNPPYMAASHADEILCSYLRDHYPDSKTDLFACFIERCGRFAREDGYYALITQQAWMFISSYERLRQKLQSHTTVTMAHLGTRAFDDIGGEVVSATAFVNVKRQLPDVPGIYIRLTEPAGEAAKEAAFHSGEGRFQVCQAQFAHIPGGPIAYWAGKGLLGIFDKGQSVDALSDFTGSQHITADNKRFLRFTWEVADGDIGQGKRWAGYAKGGDLRRWYGNLEYIVDTSDTAMRWYRSTKTANCLDSSYWFTEGITYSAVTTRGTSFRLLPPIGAFDKGGASMVRVEHLPYVLAALCSKPAASAFHLMNPTINLQVKDVKAFPILFDDDAMPAVTAVAEENIALCREDWDSFETSRDFQRHPLL